VRVISARRGPRTAAFAGLLLVVYLSVDFLEAQQAKSVLRIGYLSALDESTEAVRVQGIRRALADLGYTEGRNITFEYRYAEGKRDRFPKLAADLVGMKVDVMIVAAGDVLTGVVKNLTTTIPIIMVGAGLDPVKAGLVESLAHPGGNVTGLTNLSAQLGGKRLELLKEAVPRVKRIAVLYDPAIPPNIIEVKEALPVVARALGLTIRPWEVRKSEDFERILVSLKNDRSDALYVPEGPLMRINGRRIAGFALKSRLPSVYDRRETIDEGGLMYYGADLADIYRRIAIYLDKILKGAKPADLPVEQPTKFELVINLKTAKQIGLTIPPNVLARADRVIK
jgi:ABC-type uncharacterized transport system substrate-binding protein